ncbi:MAG TPA: DNA polymerase III subunit delta [Candidatus Saccharimonadales bacterium]|nr:DNA polymerase III subunit delta [Candidatus Saccharimonadales bacterium]
MIFFFYGPNSFAARRKLRDMMAAYVKKTGSDFGLERVDGAATTIDGLATTLLAMPFLASSRLVIIEELSANKAVADKLGKLLERVPESTVAVFYDSEVDQRTSYFKTMLKQTKAVKFDKLAVPQLTAWIKREVEKQGGTIDRPAISLLIEAAGEDQWRLEQETIKLVSYNPTVTRETIQLLVTRSDTQTIFELVDAMTAGNIKKALVMFRGLVADKTNEIYILTMVTWQLRNLLLAKTAGPLTQSELAKRAGMSPYVAGKALVKQREFSEAALVAAFLAAIETDYSIKSGQGQADQLVENLIYRVAAGSVSQQ